VVFRCIMVLNKDCALLIRLATNSMVNSQIYQLSIYGNIPFKLMALVGHHHMFLFLWLHSQILLKILWDHSVKFS